MSMKKSTKEFIKRAHESACSEWKTEIEKQWPKLFIKTGLEVGKWYKLKKDQTTFTKSRINKK